MSEAGTPPPRTVPGRHLAAAVLLALALGATLLSWVVAMQNFRVVDRERNPRVDEVFAAIQGNEARTMAVRFLASESNRAMFRVCVPAELVLALGALVLAYPGTRRRPGKSTWVLLIGVVVTAALTAALIPWFITHGRAIDFVPRSGGTTAEVRRFLGVHAAYMAMDVVKVVCSLAVIPMLCRSAQERTAAPIPGGS